MKDFFCIYAIKNSNRKYELHHVEEPHYITPRHQPANPSWILVGTYLEEDYWNMSEESRAKEFNSIEQMRKFYEKLNFTFIGVG